MGRGVSAVKLEFKLEAHLGAENSSGGWVDLHYDGGGRVEVHVHQGFRDSPDGKDAGISVNPEDLIRVVRAIEAAARA